MDSLVCAMSVMTPSEMMSRMKYCEPSVTAEAYLPSKKERGQRSTGVEEVLILTESLPGCCY